jgi:hypothetical protein
MNQRTDASECGSRVTQRRAMGCLLTAATLKWSCRLSSWNHKPALPTLPCLDAPRPLHSLPSVEKQSCFGVLYHPFQPFLQVHACHCAARDNVVFVSSDRLESQPLHPLAFYWPDNISRHPGPRSHTSRTSSSVMAPGTSLLFLKTSRLAPERRWNCQSVVEQMAPGQTSSCSNPASSWRQSSIRSRSVASTTQMSVSVFSK